MSDMGAKVYWVSASFKSGDLIPFPFEVVGDNRTPDRELRWIVLDGIILRPDESDTEQYEYKITTEGIAINFDQSSFDVNDKVNLGFAASAHNTHKVEMGDLVPDITQPIM